MKTNLKFAIFSAIALLFAALIFLAACFYGDYLDTFKYNWEMTFPDSMTLIYHYDDSGFGDGSYFYVYEVELEDLSIEFAYMSDEQIENVNKTCASLMKGMDESYLLSTEKNYIYNYRSKNGGFDYLYLVYEIELSRLTIVEVHI